VETYCWLALPVAGCLVSVQSLCVQAVGGDLETAWRLSFSDGKCVTGVYTRQRAIQIDFLPYLLLIQVSTRCRVTSLIATNALTLSQTANVTYLLTLQSFAGWHLIAGSICPDDVTLFIAGISNITVLLRLDGYSAPPLVNTHQHDVTDSRPSTQRSRNSIGPQQRLLLLF